MNPTSLIFIKINDRNNMVNINDYFITFYYSLKAIL